MGPQEASAPRRYSRGSARKTPRLPKGFAQLKRWTATRGGVVLVLALTLLLAGVALATAQRAKAEEALRQSLRNQAGQEMDALSNYFERARSNMLLTAHNPAFRDFYLDAGRRFAKVRAGGRPITESKVALVYLERLYPTSIGEACFIDRGGAENARAVRGEVAALDELSPDESKNPFFKPTFALDQGQVYQARPYVSPDTHEWVISNSTIVPMPGNSKPAMVHFEVTVESFRRTAEAIAEDTKVIVVEAQTGDVIIDSELPQRTGAPLGVPKERSYAGFAGELNFAGFRELDGEPIAYRRLPRTSSNANDWYVFARSSVAAGPLSSIGLGSIGMMFASLALLIFGTTTLRSSQRDLTIAATTDGLTGLGNRRKLMADLESQLQSASIVDPRLLVLFDLNGFKTYNDRFGHAAGDALLARLALKLRDKVQARGLAYRMGGDEFCVVAQLRHEEESSFVAGLADSLTETGEGFAISAAYGTVFMPAETKEALEALRIADGRMYTKKQGGRPSAGRQSKDVLLSVLFERSAELAAHVGQVGELASRVAGAMGLQGLLLEQIIQAAELHDIGKMAIPEAILNKPGPLTDAEWEFMRKHTLIGEKILAAAPALAGAGRLVRSSHERYDGTGYPDGLAAEEIPLGARIVAVCDAYEAMTSDRPYRTRMTPEEAAAELRAGADSQFDSHVVQVFLEACLVPTRGETR
jgi:diguanylate cyclase (GGDEF)-like protein